MRLIATMGHPLFSPTTTTAISEREACEINGTPAASRAWRSCKRPPSTPIAVRPEGAAQRLGDGVAAGLSGPRDPDDLDAGRPRPLAGTLAAEGYDVAAVPDGGAALAAAERSVPDVVVLDVAMPGLDGLAVTRRFRWKGLAVPILLLTARDALDERVAVLDAGADDDLVKPFEAREDDCGRCYGATARRPSSWLTPTSCSSLAPGRRCVRAATSSSPAGRPSCSSCCTSRP
jgi:CheY-like chemotaxis protein